MKPSDPRRMKGRVAEGYLPCKHCGVEYRATVSQIKHRHQRGTGFCSDICRRAYMKQFRKPLPVYGPCPTCGEVFYSRVRKMYCSMSCYHASPKFREMLSENLEKCRLTHQQGKSTRQFREENERECPQCGEVYYAKPSAKKKYCSNSCRRQYLADRFDRWIANPEQIALPQNYDEFLTQEELPCLVDGCDWHGQQLSLHMNLAHGVDADDFKRATGFNLKTGVIASPLREVYEARPNYNIPIALAALDKAREEQRSRPIVRQSYKSLEGREHAAKARALLGAGPERECEQCGRLFQQSTPFGRAKYCGKKCQYADMRAKANRQIYPLTCAECGKDFLGNRNQHKRDKLHQPVCCSLDCRNTFVARNIRKSEGS